MNDDNTENRSLSSIIEETSGETKTFNQIINSNNMLSVEEDVVTTEEYKSKTIIDLEYEALEIKFCEFGSQFKEAIKQEIHIRFGLPDPPENDNSTTVKNGPTFDMENLSKIVDGPELSLNTNKASTKSENILSQACKLLIDKAKLIQSNDPRQFCDINSQIELRLTSDDDFCLFLRRDPSEWYKLERKNDKNIEITANNYIEKVREENEKDNLQESNISKNYEDLEKLYECQQKFGSNRNEEKCNFYVCKDYLIYATDKFYAAARCNKQRVITICPRDHCNNEQWVQTSEAWEAVLETTQHLKVELNLTKSPIERCFVNFGHWQSQAKNNRLQPSCCHAHINIVPTMEAIEACKGRTNKFRILQESIIAPKDYRIDDVNKLDDYINRSNQDLTEIYPSDNVDDDPDYCEEELESSDELDDEQMLVNASYSFSQPYSGYCFCVTVYDKPSIIRDLSDKDYDKANKAVINVCC